MDRHTLMIGAACLLLAVAGCSEKPKEGPWLEQPAVEPAQHPGSPGGAALVPEATAGTTVLVMLEDGSLAVRNSGVPPGPAVFTVTNGGEALHDLFIEGPGVKTAAGGPIDKDGSRTLSVNLQAGTYTLYCPILDHKERELASLEVR